MQKGNRVDELIGGMIKEYDVKVPVVLVGKDKYLVGTRVRYATLRNDKITFKVGGGYMSFKDYINQYGDAEIKRITSICMLTDKDPGTITKETIKKIGTEDRKFKKF